MIRIINISLIAMMLFCSFPASAADLFTIDANKSIVIMAELKMNIYLVGEVETIVIRVPYPDKENIREKKSIRRADYTMENELVSAKIYDGKDVSKYLISVAPPPPTPLKKEDAISVSVTLESIPTYQDLYQKNMPAITIEIPSVEFPVKGSYTLRRVEVKASFPLP